MMQLLMVQGKGHKYHYGLITVGIDFYFVVVEKGDEASFQEDIHHRDLKKL